MSAVFTQGHCLNSKVINYKAEIASFFKLQSNPVHWMVVWSLKDTLNKFAPGADTFCLKNDNHLFSGRAAYACEQPGH